MFVHKIYSVIWFSISTPQKYSNTNMHSPVPSTTERFSPGHWVSSFLMFLVYAPSPP